MRTKAWGSWIPLALFLAVVATGGLLLWLKWDQALPRLCQPLVEQQQADCRKMIEARAREQLTQKAQEAPPVNEAADLRDVERRWAELTGAPPQWPQDFPERKDCDAIQEDLLALCHALESRPYLKGKIKTGGCLLWLSQTLEALAAHTPVASGELLRYESLLANVFHLFRVLGKDRLNLLREILSREEALAEPLALDLFGWVLATGRCEQAHLRIPFQTLYEYAAYFLNTVGGQVYLSRRSPKVAGLTYFYALIILDQALQKGINPHGVDIRPHIPHCRELLNRPDLIFRDQYEDILLDMEARWGHP